MKKFSQNVSKSLQHYIYAIYDPYDLTGLPFYIGQGVGNRVFSNYCLIFLPNGLQKSNYMTFVKPPLEVLKLLAILSVVRRSEGPGVPVGNGQVSVGSLRCESPG